MSALPCSCAENHRKRHTYIYKITAPAHFCGRIRCYPKMKRCISALEAYLCHIIKVWKLKLTNNNNIDKPNLALAVKLNKLPNIFSPKKKHFPRFSDQTKDEYKQSLLPIWRYTVQSPPARHSLRSSLQKHHV